jgi:glycosyltransferase involved in cell wall biosynthesis
MSTPLISILMPFHNPGPAFGAAIRSILAQTYSNWELLLCDDGSTDGSLESARAVADERIVVWSDGDRKGLAGRLNDCIDRAKGEFIARMDADDVSYPERFAKQIAFLMSHPEIDLVGCQMLVFGEDGSPLGQRRLALEHGEIVARGEWFRKNRYDVNAIRYEDVELLYRACGSSRFANLPEILYGYREMGSGFSKRLKTRMGRVRYLKATASRSMYLRSAFTEGWKMLADAALVATSGRYAMLRRRERRLSSAQNAEWESVVEATGILAPEPTRLLMITTVSETLSFFTEQLKALASNGFAVHTLCSPGHDLAETHLIPGVVSHRVPMQRRPDPIADFFAALRIARLIRRVRPEIVHAHTPKAGLVGMLAARIAGVPSRLYTIHGLPLLTRKGMYRRILELAERASCTLATHVYTVSPSLENVVAELGLCPAAKLSTIGDGSCAGIDLEYFNPDLDFTSRVDSIRSAYGIPADATLLTFAGRIAHDKGIAILDSIWPEIAREFPKAHLLIAGIEDHSDPVRADALRALQQHERVHFTRKWVTDSAALYAATDLIVLPTFREGLSQVALEAGAMRVPIVSTRIPGVVTSVRDGVTGLLVEPQQSAPFAEAVRLLLNNATLRAQLGAAGRQHLRARFDQARVNQLWISEYRKLADARPARMVRLAHIENPR